MPLGLSPLSTICCVGTDLDAKFATNGATPEARALELGPREAQTDHAPCCSVWEVDPRLLQPRFFANSARNCAALIADIIASCAAREGSPSRGAGQPGDRIMSRPERGSRTGYFLAGQVPGPRLVLDRPVPLGGARVPTVSLPAEAASTDVEPPSAPPAIQLPIRFPHRALARARNVENLSVTGPSASFCALRACPPASPQPGGDGGWARCRNGHAVASRPGERPRWRARSRRTRDYRRRGFADAHGLTAGGATRQRGRTTTMDLKREGYCWPGFGVGSGSTGSSSASSTASASSSDSMRSSGTY